MQPRTADARTAQTTELLQTLIRNRCVNDGTVGSGFEERNADTLSAFLAPTGVDIEVFDAAPGRRSLVARVPGRDPQAPSLCLMGHTDVVPVNENGWSRDPFGGELIDGEVWGRGAVDMLNLTASMAVAFSDLINSGFVPAGDLIYYAVADEESGSAYGARWMADHHADAVASDYVLTENGGLHSGTDGDRSVSINVGEKGTFWRTLVVRGTPGHGSQPFRSDNALVKASKVIDALSEYAPAPQLGELWSERIRTLGLDDAAAAALLDPGAIDAVLADLPAGPAKYLHACTHTTFSPNLVAGSMKHNVIPDEVRIGVDIRTLPGETASDVDAHLREALGEYYDGVEVEVVMADPSTQSPAHGPLWDAITSAVARPFPHSRVSPQILVGFTDARIYREMGAVAYGAGLMSPELQTTDFASRFHGNDERIDVESLALTTQFWIDVARNLWD